MWEIAKTHFTLVILPLYILSSSLYVLRVVRGPTVPDMVLAISSLSYNACFFLAVLAIYYGSYYPVIAAFLLALWTFTLDLYVAKYLEHKASRGAKGC